MQAIANLFKATVASGIVPDQAAPIVILTRRHLLAQLLVDRRIQVALVQQTTIGPKRMPIRSCF